MAIEEVGGRLRTSDGVVCVIRFRTLFGLMLVMVASSMGSERCSG